MPATKELSGISTLSKGAANIYAETIIVMISGYIFWIVMAKVASPEIIGSSSAAITLATLLSVVAGFGVPNGIQRFLGKSFIERDTNEINVTIFVAVILSAIGICSVVIVVYALKYWVFNEFNIRDDLLFIVIILTSFSTFTTLLRSIVISSLKTRLLPMIMIITSSTKLLLSLVLVTQGLGALGLTIGFTSHHVISAIFFIVFMISLFNFKGIIYSKIIQTSKNLIVASLSNWTPYLITTIGSQLGTLVVFGAAGSKDAGIYFMDLTIVTGLTGIAFSTLTIALPAASGMKDGRKRFIWNSIRMSMIFAVPLSSILIFYTADILSLLGSSYSSGGPALSTMLFSVLPTIVLTGITTLAMVYGNYSHVLGIGLATSLPRTILYFVLVPYYGAEGAALSYLLGALTGFLISLLVSKKLKLVLSTKDISVTFAVPLVLTYGLSYFHINFVGAIIIDLLLCYLIIYRLGVLTRTDIKYSISVLPSGGRKTVLLLFQSVQRHLGKGRL